MPKRPEKKPPSFSRALLLNIILVYLGLALTALAIMAWQATISTKEAAERDITNMLDRSTSRIGAMVRAAELAAGSMERVVSGAPINRASLRPALDRLLSAFEQHPYLSYMGVIVPQTGAYGLLQRKANGEVGLVLYSEAEQPGAVVQTFSLSGREFKPGQSFPSSGYDARMRPSYQTAVQGPTTGGWMPIYPWRDYAQPDKPLWGFSFVKALRDRNGVVQGVVDTDFDMPSLNRLVGALSQEFRGQIQIMQLGATPRLIAGPGLSAVPQEIPADLLPVIKRARGTFVDRIGVGGRRRWLAARQVRISGGAKWLVVVSRPAPMFNSILHRQLIQSLLFGLAIAIGIGLLSLRIGRRFGKPISDLEEYVSDVGRSDPASIGNQAPASVHDFKETSRLGQAIDQMLVERSKIQEHLAQRRRLEALGQLTGGIAHDFNNLLTIIIGSSEELVGNLRDEGQVEAAGVILAASERAAELTSRMLTFARKQTLSPRTVDLDRLISDLLPLLRRSVPAEIEVRHSLGSTRSAVFVDPAQMEMALFNLVINARDAMPGYGFIEVSSEEFLTSPDAIIQKNLQPGRYVIVNVTDNGIGMSDEVARKAFDPFFTTKDLGHGTGLGLSMVYGFASQSGGHVEISSCQGEGTTISLYLPVSPSMPQHKLQGPTDE